MESVFSPERDADFLPPRLSDAERNASILILSLFLLGAAAGAVMGLFSPEGLLPDDLRALFTDTMAPDSLIRTILASAQFPLCLLLLSSSYLGTFLVPAAVFVRAFLLSCSVSVLYAAYSYHGFLCAILSRGIPALFAVPAFLLLACDCLLLAQNLFRLKWEGRNAPLPSRFYFHLLLAGISVPLEAWYETAVLPLLLRGLP